MIWSRTFPRVFGSCARNNRPASARSYGGCGLGAIGSAYGAAGASGSIRPTRRVEYDTVLSSVSNARDTNRRLTMSLLSRKKDDSIKRCSGCGAKMIVIQNQLVRREVMMRSQGCFKCASCGRYTCYDCSDNRRPCQCGAQSWMEQAYLPG